jgi:hypothetical protein
MEAAEITPFCEMPLNEKLKIFYCRTGNHVPFQLFHLRHRLPGSAARIIAQNFASCRLASSFKTFFLVFILSPPFSWIGLGKNGLRHMTVEISKTERKVNKVNPVF